MQDPNNTQSYNRYGYCINNPLKYTDYSGESWWDDNWKSVVTIVAAVATAAVIVASAGTATPLAVGFWSGAGAGFVGGTLGTALNGGNFSQCLIAGIKGSITGAISGVMGAYAAGFAPAGIFQGALYGAGTNTLIGGTLNLLQNRSWSEGLGLNAVLGGIGGGYAGYVKAVKLGLNPLTGSPRSNTVTAVDNAIYNANVDKANQEAQIAYGKAIKSQANPSEIKNTEGGLNLFKFGEKTTATPDGWKTGDYMLNLPDRGSPNLNWDANYGALRREMNLGRPIFDSYRLPNGDLIPTTGFLNAERYILQTRGWNYNVEQGAWLFR